MSPPGHHTLCWPPPPGCLPVPRKPVLMPRSGPPVSRAQSRPPLDEAGTSFPCRAASDPPARTPVGRYPPIPRKMLRSRGGNLAAVSPLGEGDESTSGHCSPRLRWLRAGRGGGDGLNAHVLTKLIRNSGRRQIPSTPTQGGSVRSESLCPPSRLEVPQGSLYLWLCGPSWACFHGDKESLAPLGHLRNPLQPRSSIGTQRDCPRDHSLQAAGARAPVLSGQPRPSSFGEARATSQARCSPRETQGPSAHGFPPERSGVEQGCL